MELSTAIRGRRSCRSFTDQAVGAETLKGLVLDAGIWAPTGGNAQAWRFGLITDRRLLEDLSLVSPGMPRRPAAAIVVCQDLAIARLRSRDFGGGAYAVMDTAMAAENIMLAAYEIGLGTCAVAAFNRRGVQAALGLPDSIVPQLIIAVGIPAVQPKAPARNTDVYWEEHYGEDG